MLWHAMGKILERERDGRWEGRYSVYAEEKGKKGLSFCIWEKL